MFVTGKVQITGRLQWRQDRTIFELYETAQGGSGGLDAGNLFTTSLAQVLLAVNLKVQENETENKLNCCNPRNNNIFLKLNN